MAKLTITNEQEAIVVAIDSALEQVYNDGVQDQEVIPNAVLPKLQLYDTLVPNPPNDPKKQIKDTFNGLAAAMVKVLNIPRPLPTGLSATVALAKLTTNGNAGSLTFTDGLLVSKVDPT